MLWNRGLFPREGTPIAKKNKKQTTQPKDTTVVFFGVRQGQRLPNSSQSEDGRTSNHRTFWELKPARLQVAKVMDPSISIKAGLQ